MMRGLFFVLLVNMCACEICPQGMKLCETGWNIVSKEQKVLLNCTGECLPYLENRNFGTCIFYNVVSRVDTWDNVICNTLIIGGRSNEFSSMDLVKNLSFTELKIIGIDQGLLNMIFEINSGLVKQISFEL